MNAIISGPMRVLRQASLKTLLILSAAVFLRAIIPAGYMPATDGSGLLFEFCPEGVPTEFMDLVSGSSGHDHDGHDDPDDGHHCPVGHMLLSAVAIDDGANAEMASSPAAWSADYQYSFASSTRSHYNSRGPPA